MRLLFLLHFQLRPPQPAVYLFVLDVSHNAVQAGYLKYFCESLLENLDKSVLFKWNTHATAALKRLHRHRYDCSEG